MIQLYICIYTFSYFFHYSLPQNIYCSSVCYRVSPCHPICSNLHQLISDSQSFPQQLPLPLGNLKSVFYMSVSLFCIVDSIHLLFYLSVILTHLLEFCIFFFWEGHADQVLNLDPRSESPEL